MKCRDVTATIDLNEWPQGRWGRLRYRLHLIHCGACTRYRRLSLALGEAMRGYARDCGSPADLERLNRSLLAEHSPTK